jgi:tetratricopeptide (TPR) repeat protein
MAELTLTLSQAVQRVVDAYERGELDDADRLAQAILGVKADCFDALYVDALVKARRGRHDEALAGYDRALAVRRDHAEALYHRANTLQKLGRFQEALASYDRTLVVRPNYAEALYNRGNTLQKLGRSADALASYDQALAVSPDYAEALNNRGNMLHMLGRFEEALASYDRALMARPDYAEALSNRSGSLRELKRFGEALTSCDRALAVRPNYADALSNRGNALRELRRFEDALASYEQALALCPGYAEALSNRGTVLHALKRFDAALASYDRAIAARPDYAEAHANKSHLQLLTGNFEAGPREIDWRWKRAAPQSPQRDFVQPVWIGDAIKGKAILLHGEEGFGDSIQFCRYVPPLAALGATVLLEVPAPLQSLMASLGGASRVFARGEQLPDFDLHCPLLSLPRAFRTTIETIPADVPYLSVPAVDVRRWGARLERQERPRIGLAWSGNPKHRNDRDRSIALRSLLQLLDVNASFVSLQKDVRPGDAAVLQERGDLLHFEAELRDFADTGALIANLDLVISVDTSVAHLAGALAKPVWILLPFVPDWRWLLDRADNP